MAKADILIVNIGELVTFNQGPLPGRKARDPKAAGIIRDAAIAVREGRVVDVGRSPDLRGRYQARITIDAGGRLATPALVDPHTHLVFAGSREDEFELKLAGARYEEILARGGGIYRTVRATREASEEELRALARERLRLMARHGSSIVEVKTGYGLLPEHEYKMLRALRGLEDPGLPKVVPTLLAHVVPQEYLGDREAYIRLFTQEIIPGSLRQEPKPRYIDVFCDKGAFTPEETRKIIEAGLRHGLRVRLHAEEIAYTGCSLLARDYPIDSMDHLEHLPPSHARILAETGTAATLLPTSMLAVFAEKKPPVEALRDAGAIIALATDYNPNNMNPNPILTMELATYLLRLTPLEALAAATINAAYSLRIHETHGHLAPGAHANIIIWSHPNYKWIGYDWGHDNTQTIIIDGVIVENKLEARQG